MAAILIPSSCKVNVIWIPLDAILCHYIQYIMLIIIVVWAFNFVAIIKNEHYIMSIYLKWCQ